MNGRVRGVSGHLDVALSDGWQLAATPAGAVTAPAGLATAIAAADWSPATAPTTAAGALRAAGRWSLDHPARRFDADDWWWRLDFAGGLAGDGGADDEVALCLDGVATLAEVWLNGEPLAELDNMFVGRRLPVTLAAANQLVIRCRALDAALLAKRPRPRWRAPMIEHPQLRWHRTTLLGRTPGWSPPAAAVGPWRPVRLERRRGVAVDDVQLRAHLRGDAGVVEVAGLVRALGGAIDDVTLVVASGDRAHAVALVRAGDHVAGTLVIPAVDRWWPHTHGEPALYQARLEIRGATPATVELGPIGFRTITAVTADGGFALRVNDAPVFCRGACWTPLDPVTLAADDAASTTALAQVAAAGMNMVRVGGTMVYESDGFLDAADAAGVLLWQDLMFANMDYPEDDPGFVASVTTEVRQQLARLQARPSVAVICGNSEGEQQAAMWGAGRERWRPGLFHDHLAGLAGASLPDVPYWPSSAHGGAFPHQGDRGTTSYYGVGAYLRPLDDARRAEVRFATECLAFANVPAPRTIERMPGGAALKVHHPAWKARTPRDLGAGWDFDDVRDHYLATGFGVDPAALRYADHDRYLALGRVITGEVMAQVFGEWRRARSTCGGGLIWFLRDLWPGAGWGVIGADGVPKAAYHYLARALAPLALHLSDEGGNGVVVHVANDRPAAITGELEVVLYRGGAVVGRGRGAVEVPAGGAVEVPALTLFDGFLDLGHAYRFGPATTDLIVATLSADGAALADAFHFPLGLPARRDRDLGLQAQLAALADGDLELTVTTRDFAQAISVELAGFAPSDDFFHLAPGGTRVVRLRRLDPTAAPSGRGRGTLTALNAESSIPLQVP